MDLIPGLLDDVGLECLIRVPYHHFYSVASVCRRWKVEVELPEFWRHRKVSGLSQPMVAIVQALVNPNLADASTDMKSSVNLVYRLTVCEPGSGKWTDLPPMPGYSDGLPMFCQLAGVGLDLVVIGGWNPVTWEVSNAVYIYNFVSATWRRGADMPGGPRSLFACASDLDRTVYVAGGHDSEKNALRSAIAYDVERNEWVQLPDMALERDECKGVFHCGKFHVIGGYKTEMQGQFSKSAEAFDVATWSWVPVQDDLLESATCPDTCVDGGDGRLYMCRDRQVVALESSTCRSLAELPADVQCTAHMTAWQGKLFVIGLPKYGEAYIAYVLDLKSSTWTRVEAPVAFSGHVQSGCWLEI